MLEVNHFLRQCCPRLALELLRVCGASRWYLQLGSDQGHGEGDGPFDIHNLKWEIVLFPLGQGCCCRVLDIEIRGQGGEWPCVFALVAMPAGDGFSMGGSHQA